MRLILQLCVMVLMLLGAGNRVWGKVAVGQNIAVRGFAEGEAFGNGVDEPPALMSSGEAAAWGYDCTVDVRDGPNVYAYCVQNPWSKFDPEGLSVWLKLGKYALKGGDFAMTVAGIVEDGKTFMHPNSTFGQRFGASFSILSEVLPASVGDIKDGYKWGKKALGYGDDAKDAAKQADNAKDTLSKVEQTSKAQNEAAEQLAKKLEAEKQAALNKKSGGRKGSDETREQNGEWSEYTKETTGAPATGGAGGKLPETFFPPTAGSPTGRFADVVNTVPTTGQRFIANTVDTTARGGLTKYEIGAAVDIIKRMKPGDVFTAIPKIKPPLRP